MMSELSCSNAPVHGIRGEKRDCSDRHNNNFEIGVFLSDETDINLSSIATSSCGTAVNKIGDDNVED
jgi:hypothetical protein